MWKNQAAQMVVIMCLCTLSKFELLLPVKPVR
jgi:hypothetical protein